MRLIDVETLKLEVFHNDKAPRYAILSHTWGKDDEEITFPDIESGQFQKPGSGYTKLQGCCEQAKKDGYKYIWIDTCCIDKRDSVELGEAINSMFRWYRTAAVCYAYLTDVPGDENPKTPGSSFRASRWFERGWTLQELLAPKDLTFYGNDWRPLGTKASLCATIESTTRIPRHFLKGLVELRTASVAQRMAWAARRQTKRAEDMAYCLLGIFGITMPMIYGEGGEQAFFRLQETIMKTTSDHSILAWGFSSPPETTGCPALALSPSYFADSEHIIAHGPPGAAKLSSISIYGGLLRLHLTLASHPETGQTFGMLNCGSETANDMTVGIPLVETTHGEFTRSRGANALLWRAPAHDPTLIHVKHEPHDEMSEAGWYFHYDDDDFTRIGLEIIDVFPAANWNKEKSFIGSIPGNTCEVKRLAIRIRHSMGKSPSSNDFVTIITLIPTHGDAHVNFESVTCICGRATPSEEIIEHLPFLGQKAKGNTRASNGELSVTMTIKDTLNRRPNMFDLRPVCDAATPPPHEGFNITLELQRVLALVQLEKASSAKRLLNGRHEELKKEIAAQDRRMKRWVKKLNAVDREMRALELHKIRLAQLISKGTKHSESLGEKIVLTDKASRNVDDELHSTNDKLEALQLRDHGIKLRAASGETPLLMCAREGYTAEVKVLLSCGADVAATDVNGETPLVHALREGHFHVAKLLSETGVCGVNMVEKASHLRTLGRAVNTDNLRLVRNILDSKELDLSLEHKDGQALFLAARKGCAEAVALLFKYNAVGDINSRDKWGHTPLFYAVRSGMAAHYDILRLFRDVDAHIYYPFTSIPGAEYPMDARFKHAAFSSDSKTLAIARDCPEIEIWGQVNRRPVRGYSPTLGDCATQVAFSADSKRLAAGSTRGSVRVWVIGLWGAEMELSGHRGAISSLQFSPDSKCLASGSDDEMVVVWDIENGSLLWRLTGHKQGVAYLVFSDTSGLLATASRNGIVKVWDLTKNCREVFEDQLGSAVASLQHIAARGRFAVAHSDFSKYPSVRISVWEIAGQRRTYEPLSRDNSLLLETTPEGTLVIAWSRGFKRYLAQKDPGVLQIWDADFQTRDSVMIDQLDMSDMDWDPKDVVGACFSADSSLLAVFLPSGVYRVFRC